MSQKNGFVLYFTKILILCNFGIKMVDFGYSMSQKRDFLGILIKNVIFLGIFDQKSYFLCDF
jgi:type IV secretory pathway TrbL component